MAKPRKPRAEIPAAPDRAQHTATIGFEAKLWLAADKLRNNMDAAEYKHVVLGLIFLKYISDSFEEHRAKLLAGEGDYAGANPEDPDEYKAENVFWVPADARWSHLQANAKQPTIGKTVDDAMVAIERDNPRLKGVLPKDYARPGLDKHRLGELIDLIATISLTAASEGGSAAKTHGRRQAQGHCRRTHHQSPPKRDHRLEPPRKCESEDQSDRKAHPEFSRLPARPSGRRRANRAAPGRAAIGRLGGGIAPFITRPPRPSVGWCALR
jgi:hypothetical protein